MSHLSFELPVVVYILSALWIHIHVLRDVLDAHMFVKLSFNFLQSAEHITVHDLTMGCMMAQKQKP